MQKVKISSTSKIKVPKEFDGVEADFGFSFYDYDLGAFSDKNEKNSWFLKALSHIDSLKRMFSFFKKDNASEIIEEIVECSDFIIKEQPENTEGLMVQINTEDFSKYEDEKRVSVKNFSKEAAFIYSEEKRMFLGVDAFNSDLKNFSKREQVAYVFFHEFSHASQYPNNEKFGHDGFIIPLENPLHQLYSNLLNLSHPSYYAMMKAQSEDFAVPSQSLIKNIMSVYKETYADAGGLLLLRNKLIKDGNYSEEKFFKMIEGLIEQRSHEKTKNVEIKESYGYGLDSVITSSHYTSPGLEILKDTLQKELGKDRNKLLNEEEIHRISNRSMEHNVIKTLYAYIHVDDYLISKIGTLLSFTRPGTIPGQPKSVIRKDKNYYKETFDQIRRIIPQEEQDVIEKKIREINSLESKTKHILAFDAVIDDKVYQKSIELEKFQNKTDELLEFTVSSANPNKKINIYESIRLLENQQIWDYLEKLIENNPTLEMPNKKILLTIRKITRDTADITEKILIQRNEDIQNGVFNYNEFKEKIIETMKSKNVPGLEELLSKGIVLNSNTIMNIENIQDIIDMTRKNSLSKTLYSLIKSNNLLVPQIATLTCIQTIDGKLSVNSSNYATMMKQIQGNIGEKWIESFNTTTKGLREHPYLDKETKSQKVFDLGLKVRTSNQIENNFQNIIPETDKNQKLSSIERMPNVIDINSVKRNIKKINDLSTQSPTYEKNSKMRI